jgi:type IV secretory pathway VirD2 relaxase
MADSQQEREKAHALGLRLPKGKRGIRPPPVTTLRRRFLRTGLAHSSTSARGFWVSHFSSSRLQRSTVKVSYARNGAKGGWAAHGRYLAREGAQREGGRGKGFGAIEDEIDIPKELGRWQKAGDPRIFKLIVSPEAGAELDLREHARAVMREVEKDLGTGLEWVAIDHHNTDNPHVHIVLRGIDANGHELRIDRDYVKSGFRRRSQEAATQKLGLRTERSLLSAREQAVERQQFTDIDRAILRRADDSGIVRYEGPIPESRASRKLRLIELQRLVRLSEMGLAERIGERSWRLRPDLETALREFQRAHDVLKTRARHQELISDPFAPLVRTELRPGLVLIGKVVGTGLADEAADRRYVLLEGTDGRVHYVERPPGDAPSLRPGRIVTIAVFEEEVRGLKRPRLEIHEHGRLEDLQAKRTPSTPLDREALRAIAERGGVEESGESMTFAAAWRRAVRERLFLLQEAGLVATIEARERRQELLQAGRQVMEDLMRTLDRHLPSLEELAAEKGRAIGRAEPKRGARLRGRLVAYAHDTDGSQVAVVDTGRELLAVAAMGKAIREGTEVRVRAEEIEAENQRRRLLIWRIASERDLDRGR